MKIFGGEVLYLDYGSGYMTAGISQNSLNYRHSTYTFHYMQILPQNKKKTKREIKPKKKINNKQ